MLPPPAMFNPHRCCFVSHFWQQSRFSVEKIGPRICSVAVLTTRRQSPRRCRPNTKLGLSRKVNRRLTSWPALFGSFFSWLQTKKKEAHDADRTTQFNRSYQADDLLESCLNSTEFFWLLNFHSKTLDAKCSSCNPLVHFCLDRSRLPSHFLLSPFHCLTTCFHTNVF